MSEILSHEIQECIRSAICSEVATLRCTAEETALAHAQPSAVYRPRVYIDGNQWCALYGDNIQDGVTGFGCSPAEAMHAFDQAWVSSLKDKT